MYDGEAIVSDRKLIRETANKILEAVTKGYGQTIAEAEWNSPDFIMLDKLTQNVFDFSAAKDYRQIRDMNAALRDGDRIRSFREFREQVNAINGKYNGNWLRAEYNHAIAASQSAARWTEFESRKKTMPYLQYMAIMDVNTREDHAALNGVIKAIDDKFWSTWFPPNGWGCRCEAVQLPGSGYNETPDNKIVYPTKTQKNFKINFGKEKIVFPPEHPYYKNMPANVVNTLKQDVKNGVNNYYNNIVKQWANENVKGGKTFEADNLYSGKIKIAVEDTVKAANHLTGSTKSVITHCIENINTWEQLEANVGLKHPRTDFSDFNNYKVTLGDKDYVIQVGISTKTKEERFYTVFPMANKKT